MYLAPNINLSGKTLSLPNGDRGIYQTVAMMRRLVLDSKISPYIRACALNVVYLHPQKIALNECEQVFNFVRDNIRYVMDVEGVETLAAPEITIQIKQGDCDDKSCLLAAMLESIGYKTRFVVAGYNDSKVFEHVYVQVLCDNDWIDCDTTEEYPFGWCPPDPLRIFFERV